MLHASTVEGKHFWDWTNGTSISNTIMTYHYQAHSSLLQITKTQLLKTSNFNSWQVCSTANCWTALTAKNYLTISCHYIWTDSQMSSAFPFAENFRVVGIWRPCYIITKNSTPRVRWVFVAALQISFSWPWTTDLHYTFWAIALAEKLVSQFIHSAVTSEVLKEEQLDQATHLLIQSGKTWWSAFCEMFDWLMEKQWAVVTVVGLNVHKAARCQGGGAEGGVLADDGCHTAFDGSTDMCHCPFCREGLPHL